MNKIIKMETRGPYVQLLQQKTDTKLNHDPFDNDISIKFCNSILVLSKVFDAEIFKFSTNSPWYFHAFR